MFITYEHMFNKLELNPSSSMTAVALYIIGYIVRELVFGDYELSSVVVRNGGIALLVSAPFSLIY